MWYRMTAPSLHVVGHEPLWGLWYGLFVTTTYADVLAAAMNFSAEKAPDGEYGQKKPDLTAVRSGEEEASEEALREA
ncbi:MAG TPA: hypothetical protein VFK74_01130 [Azospira sp.]|nr:hypothetical protein [Azospira sp.]